MPDAWDLIPQTERDSDNVTTFILLCEDTVNEPSYFRSFEKSNKVKINVVEGQLSSFKNIVNTLQYCEKEGLLEIIDNHYQLKPGITKHVWSVFDRDVESVDAHSIDPANDMQFSFSIQSAQKAGIKVAWSNDAFELWILLHFEDVEPGLWRHRTYIYERLTAIFKAIPEQSAEMAAITGRENFNYKIFLKRRSYFVLYVLPKLLNRREYAIQRAKALESVFNAQQPYHQCNPCTKVHQLVTSILSFT
jgi:hypothetical protein